MILRIILFLFSFSLSKDFYVSYGWELFEYSQSARTAALGRAVSAYDIGSNSMVNPVFGVNPKKKVAFTHQNRFAGIVSNDLIAFNLGEKKTSFNLIYENIGDIPDTRNVLLDWGYDGQYGTYDIGEGNGILDEGERLSKEKISFFNQRKIGIYGAFSKSIKSQPFGFGIKMISSSLNESLSLGIGIDVGTIKQLKNISYAFILRNFPTSGIIWENGTIEGTLPSITLGVNKPIYAKRIESLKIHLLFSTEINLSNRHLGSQIRFRNLSIDNSFGLESIFKENFFCRFGRNNVNNFTGGLGFDFNYMTIDYAFLNSAFKSSLGRHHIISFNLSYDWIMMQFYKI